MQPISPATFDPTAANSGSFRLSLANGGWLVLINESPSGLLIGFANGSIQKTVPPWCLRSMRVDTRINDASWQVFYTLPVGQAPISLVIGECFNPTEWTMGERIVPLVRQVNQGNTHVGGLGTQLINDAQAAATSIIEATQSGSTGSNVLFDNSGNAQLGEWSGSVFTKIWQTIANAAANAASVILGKAGTITKMLGGLTTVGSSNLDNGQIITSGAGVQTNTATANTAIPLSGALKSAPASGQTSVLAALVTGDAQPRLAGFIRSDGFGGLRFSQGSTAQDLYLQGDGLHATVNLIAASFLGALDGTWHTPGLTDRGFSVKDASPQIEVDAVAPNATARDVVLAAVDASAVLHAGARADSIGVGHAGTDDAGTKRLITRYIGATDPSTRNGITVNEGDEWVF